MKRLCVVLAVFALLTVVVGFYRGWFDVSTSNHEGGSNKANVNLSLDRDKIQEDAETVKDKANELTGATAAGAKKLGERFKDSTGSR